MQQINVSQNRKTRIICKDEARSVEIGKTAIDRGLLKRLPEPTLSIMLYLLTRCSENNRVQTNATGISGYIPYSTEKIKNGLQKLTQHGIIHISNEKNRNHEVEIAINPDKLLEEDLCEETQEREDNDASRAELRRTLHKFVPPGKSELLADSIERWLDDFDKNQLLELIRRVNKWQDNNSRTQKETFYYLQGIIDDWYEKEIFSYKRLQHFDRLFRETRELARIYGFKNWQNVSPAQMEVFRKWLSDENALGYKVIKLAITEAVRRKKDGRPSLKYIEDNFIKPWKKAGIKTVQQAEKYLDNNNNKNRENFSSKHPGRRKGKRGKENKQQKTGKTPWENFSWDFSDLQRA
ncbi:MAG: DnaD domain-containing protein [Halanaerobiales bacterium]